MARSIDYAFVADLYDTYVRTDLDISFFLSEVKKGSGEVLELMSGTGRVSIPLIEAGVRLTCVDNSPEMLNILRDKLQKRSLSPSVFEMDVRELSLRKKFELIVIPFHSFAELTTPSDQRKALARIHDHLMENGRFICTLHNPSVRLRSVDGQLHLRGEHSLNDGRGMLQFWNSENYDSDRGIVKGLQCFEEYDASGTLRSKRTQEIQFSLLRKKEFENRAKSEGFEIIELYGDYSYSTFQDETSPFMIWILQK